MLELFLTAGIGLVAGTAGAIVGGGGLISIPFLIFAGLPAPVAIATSHPGFFGMSATALGKYIREDRMDWRIAAPLSIAAIIGSLGGAWLLTETPEAALTPVVGGILLTLTPILFFDKKFGLAPAPTTPRRKIAGFFAYFLLTIFAGFFGGGAGIFMVMVLVGFFGLDLIRATAVKLFLGGLIAFCVSIFFWFENLLDLRLGVALLAGMTVGGWIGAHLALKNGEKFVKKCFVAVIFFSAIKLLFF